VERQNVTADLGEERVYLIYLFDKKHIINYKINKYLKKIT